MKKLDIRKELEKVALAKMREIAQDVLTPEEYSKAEFTFNGNTGRASIKNISDDAVERLQKAMK